MTPRISRPSYLLQLRTPRHELEAEPIIDHGEVARGERHPLPIDPRTSKSKLLSVELVGPSISYAATSYSVAVGPKSTIGASGTRHPKRRYAVTKGASRQGELRQHSLHVMRRRIDCLSSPNGRTALRPSPADLPLTSLLLDKNSADFVLSQQIGCVPTERRSCCHSPSICSGCFRRFAFDVPSSRHPCALDHSPTTADGRRSSHLQCHVVPRITFDALFQNRAF